MTPSILAIHPGAKISAKDRKTLSDAGVIVIQVDPSQVRAIESVSLLRGNDMLRCALETINSTTGTYAHYSREIRADFAKRLIESYLAYGSADAEAVK